MLNVLWEILRRKLADEITRRARTYRWRKMRRRPGRFNRRSWGQWLNCRRSADCITVTNGERLEELFSN